MNPQIDGQPTNTNGNIQLLEVGWFKARLKQFSGQYSMTCSKETFNHLLGVISERNLQLI